MNSGIVQAVSAYVIWGVFPIYYKWLPHVSAPQLLAHRIVWSCLMLAVVVLCMRQLGVLRATALRPAVLRTYALAAVLIAINWLAFLWAVSTNLIVEASLGYFITPLVNVVLGVAFLGERPRAAQWGAIALAAMGVLYLTLSYSSPPWIALVLALSFGVYGLLKKTAPLGSVDGVTLETALLVLPAVAYLFYIDGVGSGAFLHAGWHSDALLIGAGILGTLPLLLFAAATKRASLTLIGLLFYIAPTLQFLIGVLLYEEPFTLTRLIGFGIVWLALAVFLTEGIFTRRATLQWGRAIAAAAEAVA
jgi:chloramphenicol-sensitive protein RarD